MSCGTVVVIGGGPGGLRAADGVVETGGKVVLIEQREFLGGNPVGGKLRRPDPHGEPAQPQIRQMIEPRHFPPRGRCQDRHGGNEDGGRAGRVHIFAAP